MPSADFSTLFRVTGASGQSSGDGRARSVNVGGERRPLLHALVSPGVAGGWGMEVDRIKCDKAAAFLAQAAAALLRRGAVPAALPVPLVRCAPVERARRPCPVQ